MNLRVLLSVGGAVATGVAHGVLLAFVHAQLAVHFSMAAWVYSLGLGRVAANSILFPIDLALNVVLSIPAVLVLRLLKPWHQAWYVLLALLAFLIWAHLPAASLPGRAGLSWHALWDLAVWVAPLPLAAWLIGRRWVPPGSSLDGMPLRGTP